MLKNLDINEYRGIQNSQLDNLGKINIIAGENNTGKTSILEVIESLERPNSLRAWRVIGRREGNTARISTNLYDNISTLFPVNNYGDETHISYSGIVDDIPFPVKISGKISDVILSGGQMRHISGYSRAANSADFEDTSDSEEYESSALDIELFVNGEPYGEDRIYALGNGFQRDNNREVSIINNVLYISPTQHANNTLYLNSLMTNTQLYEEFVEIMKQFDPDFYDIS